MRPHDSGFLAALVAPPRARVEFILAGVGGIDCYARDADDSVETKTIDALLARRVGVLRTALVVLGGVGFSF